MSDLDIMKACEVMNSWNDNEQVGNDNEPCVLVTNERTWNAVAVAQPPMSDRENVLGWHMGAEVKYFGKDVMQIVVVSMVFFCIGWNAKCFELRGQPVG